MTSGPKLVNNQFNSPVKLYSQQAIQETLDRQTQILSNGAVGIDFNQLAKPTNLQNSAVLRMLEEEEERKRLGKAGLKRVAWPPPKDEQQDSINFIEQGPVQAKDHQNPQSYYQVQNIAPHFEPPPATITLRPEPPVTQETSPVYQAQPAAINPNSGSMRGDQKWPPAPVKEQTEAENRARIELAKGPVFRPRRVNKDYSSFFAQHASTNNYPGYRAPPGTQYFTPAYHQH